MVWFILLAAFTLLVLVAYSVRKAAAIKNTQARRRRYAIVALLLTAGVGVAYGVTDVLGFVYTLGHAFLGGAGGVAAVEFSEHAFKGIIAAYNKLLDRIAGGTPKE